MIPASPRHGSAIVAESSATGAARPPVRSPWRREAAFDAELAPYRVAADRVMLAMTAFLFVVCLALAPVQATWTPAALIGGGTLLLCAWLVRRFPGALVTRLAIACGFMTYTGLVIHQTGGSIEGHFTAFGLIGILLYYRDWRVIAAATVYIYLHHLLLGYAQTLGLAVYVFDTRAFWSKFAIHVAYFLPFVVLMGYLAIELRREGYENRRVIRLAREVADGDFKRRPPSDAAAAAPAENLLHSVTRMRDCVVDLLHSMPIAVMLVHLDRGTVADVNDAFCRLFGLDASIAIGREVALLPIWTAADAWPALRREMQRAGEAQAREAAMQRAGGAGFTALITSVEHRTDQLHLSICAFEDVTLRRETERRMRHLAFHDLLTGLHNRAALMRHLDALIEHRRHERRAAAAQGGGLLVLVLDLDDFKPVNDRHGHEAGDRVLEAVARRIDGTRREGDFAARLGGDEFVVVLAPCDHGDIARQTAARLRQAIRAPVDVPGDPACTVDVTIGAAWYPPGVHPEDSAAALALADAALYDGKRAGKGTFTLRSA